MLLILDSSSSVILLFKNLASPYHASLLLIRVDLQVNHLDAERKSYYREKLLQGEERNHDCYMMLNKYYP